MNTVQIILTIALCLVSVVLVVLVLMQEGKSNGLGAIAGAGAGESYVSRNEGHTPEGKLRKYTRIFGALFMLLSLAIYIVTRLAA